MEARKRNMSPYERAINDITREHVEEVKAVTDYNIMMGILEDPAEEEEENE